MRRLTTFISVTVLALMLLPPAIPAAAQNGATVTTMPVTGEFIGCTGEVIVLSGTRQMVFHSRMDKHGGTHFQFRSIYQGVIGVGQTSGDVYHFTGGDADRYNSSVYVPAGSQSEQTIMLNFQLVGPGPGNRVRVHEVHHYTFNANGNATAEVIHSSGVCLDS